MNEHLTDNAVEQALEYFENGNFEAAHALYERMLEDEPENFEVLYMLSMCRQKQSRLPEAAAYLEQAIQLQPRSALFHYTMGGLQMRLYNADKALEHYRQATEFGPGEPKTWLGYGYGLMVTGQLNEAEEQLRTALRAVGDDALTEATITAHLGVIAMQRNQIDKAISWLTRAIELNPDDSYCQTQLGRALQLAGRYAFAVQCFRNARRLMQAHNVDDPQLKFWLAEALEATGEYEKALGLWRELLESGQHNVEVFCRAARAYLRVGATGQAVNLLRSAEQSAPDNSEIRRLLAEAWQRQGRHEQAIAELQQCPASDRAAQRQLVRAYLAVHRHAEAVGLSQQLMADGDDEDHLLAAQAAAADLDTGAAHRALNQLGAREQEAAPARWLRCLADAAPLMQSGLQDTDLERLAGELQSLLRQDDTPAAIRNASIHLLARVRHHQGAYREVLETLSGLPQQNAAILDTIADQTTDAAVESLDFEIRTPESVFDADIIRSWPPGAPGLLGLKPVFVLGWPGSGRRQLLQALRLHSGIDCLVDRPLQAGETADRFGGPLDRLRLLTWPRDPRALSQLAEDEWLRKRQGYKKQITHELGHFPDKIFVDGLMLPVQGLIAIQRLFPQASLIIVDADIDALRLAWHWSGFADIEGMQEVWEQQQAWLEQARQALLLNMIDIDSRTLLSDPQAALTPLLNAMNLEWEEDLARPFRASPLYPPLADAGKYRELLNA